MAGCCVVSSLLRRRPSSHAARMLTIFAGPSPLYRRVFVVGSCGVRSSL